MGTTYLLMRNKQNGPNTLVVFFFKYKEIPNWNANYKNKGFIQMSKDGAMVELYFMFNIKENTKHCKRI